MTNRVIQWATGLAGKYSIQAIAHHPALELVGAKVFSTEKVGVDVGTICGIAPLGVAATDSEEDILALDADCVVHMGMLHPALEDDVGQLCRLLESGKNVVTVLHWMFNHPETCPPELRDPVEAACAKGNSTLHFSGVHPGFMCEGVVPTLTGACRKVDNLYVRELLDYGEYENPAIPSLMGFGKDRSIAEGFLTAGGFMNPSIRLMAQSMGAKVEKIDYEWELHIAERDWEATFGVIPEGTVAASRFKYSGFVGGEPRVFIEHFTRTHPDQMPDWPSGEGYTISIEGEPSMSVDIELGVGKGRSSFVDAYIATADAAVNSVPAVCDARPGIVTRLDLPMITGVGALAD